nr:unnamed protein product [Callosobruchus analis]
MARKYLSDKELQEIINDPTFFDDLSTPDNPEDDDSDDEEEEIQNDDRDSKSELEYDPVDDEGSKLESGGRKEDSYIGKGRTTLWRKVEVAATKTKKKNIMKRFPAPNTTARNMDNEVDALLQTIDISMTEEIVKFTNIYIQYKKDLPDMKEKEMQKKLHIMSCKSKHQGVRKRIFEKSVS